jgi:hypothetical protein
VVQTAEDGGIELLLECLVVCLPTVAHIHVVRDCIVEHAESVCLLQVVYILGHGFDLIFAVMRQF